MFKLEISLKRVQTFIFDVPRLKAMLGANALIGETMRHALSKLVVAKAQSLSLEWPERIELITSPQDPLHEAHIAKEDRDDPIALYRNGILARDGGHFIVAFDKASDAEAFKLLAEEKLAECLPGVLFDADIKPFDAKQADKKQHREVIAQEIQLLDLPVLQVCQETGQGPASEKKDRWQSASVSLRLNKGEEFYNGSTKDIIGLMRRQLYPDRMGKKPNDLARLAAGDYIALLHADGNGIGLRYNAWRDRVRDQDAVIQEAHGEAFYHSMRVVVRRAIVDALGKTFKEDQYTIRPYEILMLGGDDLLLVCKADKVLELACNYAQQLAQYSLADGKPLHVAIGVAMAKKTYPLHRLHELAESLASSAKRLYRSFDDDGKVSVIDWQVVTQSWFEGVAEARRQSEIVAYTVGGKPETLLLTGRPYAVTGHDGLKGLLAAAKRLDSNSDTARSPLRALRSACEQGRLSGQMAFDRLPKSIQKELSWANGQNNGAKLWDCRKVGDNEYQLTKALDIIGIREISRLGKKKPDNAKASLPDNNGNGRQNEMADTEEE